MKDEDGVVDVSVAVFEMGVLNVTVFGDEEGLLVGCFMVVGYCGRDVQ